MHIRFHSPAVGHDIAVAAFDRGFDVHWKVAETVDLDGFTNATQNEQDLHIDLHTTRTDRPADVVEEADVSGADVADAWVFDRMPIELIDVKDIPGSV